MRETINAFEHPIRERILSLLDGQEMTVSEIQKELRIQQPLVSQHLKSLRISNLVIARRDGRFIYYSRNPHVIKSLFDCCKRFSMAQETLSGSENYLNEDETESSELNPDNETTHDNDVQSS